MKLSYLVATFNSPQWLDLHLENLIVGQKDPDFEVVVIHHGSPSYDLDIGRKWERTDQRVRNVIDADFGCYGPAWVYGWKNASGEFVVNSNTDDFHHPDFTHEFYSHMKAQNDRVGFGYAGLCVINEERKIIGGGQKPPFDFDLMSRECWAGPQVCWRNDAKFLSSLDMNLILQRSKEYTSAFDYWLWLYFMSLGYTGTVIPKVLTYYTQRSNSVENQNKWLNNYETYSSISEFFPHNFNHYLKHAKEFIDFNNRPPKTEWIELMQKGKKWK